MRGTRLSALLAVSAAHLAGARNAMTSPLSKLQRLSTPRWARLLDPSISMLVQVGAYDHAPQGHLEHDPAPGLVSRGWKSILIEPIVPIFERLKANYASRTRAGLRIVNAAVCPRCDMPSPRMHFLDVASNSSFGSRDSDVRCMNQSGLRWVTEIASFSARHLLKHEYLFSRMPRKCEACGKALGRPLTPSCMRRLISKNIRTVPVPCFCLRSELASEPTVTLLTVDAEGHDFDVLNSYPFDVPHLRPWRVHFEARHLSRASYLNATALLSAHGYGHVAGSRRAEADTWHLIASAEPKFGIRKPSLATSTRTSETMTNQ